MITMTPRVLSSEQVTVDSEDAVVLARRRVRLLAETLGFDPFAVAAITTATSELCRNALVHAEKGTATVEQIMNGTRTGIRVELRDQGPGIANLDRVLAGGYSTAKSLGLGVSGSSRLVDEFRVDTTVGQGTVVVVVKWKRLT
jgi:serine/threonine-protein kinase RsbT